MPIHSCSASPVNRGAIRNKQSSRRSASSEKTNALLGGRGAAVNSSYPRLRRLGRGRVDLSRCDSVINRLSSGTRTFARRTTTAEYPL